MEHENNPTSKSARNKTTHAKSGRRATGDETPAAPPSTGPRQPSAANQPDLEAQVADLQKQIAALSSQLSALAPNPSAPPQLPALQSQVSGSIPVYELQETRPVGYQAQDTLDSTSEDSQDGFYASLLDRARIAWLMGDWASLAKIDWEQIQHHPDRAKLALFGACGRIQTNEASGAKKYLAFAKSQGCSRNLINSVLLSGIHSSIYSANALLGRENKCLAHQTELNRLGLLGAGTSSELLHSNKRLSPPNQDNQGSKLSVHPRILALAKEAASDEDSPETVSRSLRNEDLSKTERFHFLFQLAKEFQSKGNKMVASSYLEEASQVFSSEESSEYAWHVVKGLLELGLAEEAFAKRLNILEKHPLLTNEEALSLKKAGATLLEKIFDFKGHGHEVLMAVAKRHADRLRGECTGRKPVIIEIGTTRESSAGQGSTRRLAEFCHQQKFHFITVDMDRANTDIAKQMFQQNGYAFDAIHSKGEDFLSDYSGSIDGIFIDAYDFDHGKHTELRQSRYEKFLGSRINEADCHEMHLECVRHVIGKANPWTLICLDDTWLNLGRWTAKGTLAVPFLLENEYQLLDVRNRAVVMGSKYWLEQVPHVSAY